MSHPDPLYDPENSYAEDIEENLRKIGDLCEGIKDNLNDIQDLNGKIQQKFQGLKDAAGL